MKKLLALLATACILLPLCSCDWFTKNPDDKTTAATTAAAPTDAPTAGGAVMAPIQGGPMLYTFWGREAYRMEYSDYLDDEYPVYPIGLVDQDGKLVSPAIYHNVQYIYDQAEQRVTGLAAVKGREITIYELNGQNRVLPIEGYRIEVFPGGRYAVIYTAEGFTFTGGMDITDPLREGIFDLRENKFAVDPKIGQMIHYATGGVALGYQYDSPDGTGTETAQWAFNAADASVTDLPISLGRVQQYFPETGWYGGMWMEMPGSAWTMFDYEQRVYDKDLKLIPALSGWSIDYEGFGGGAWCMVYNNDAFPGVTTWVNREGVLSDKRYAEVQTSAGGKSYSINKDGNMTALLDADLTEVFSLKTGERFAKLPTTGGSDEGYLHLNADGSVKAAYDLAGKPMQAPEAFRCWGYFSYDAVEGGSCTLYAAKDGQWTVLDLSQFLPSGQAEDGIPYANPIVMCKDYIVVSTGVHWYEWAETYDTFAIDWQGNRLDTCPLAPFFGLLNYQTAGEQGPHYYWIELEDGEQQFAKRGYINLKGEWLFVDEG